MSVSKFEAWGIAISIGAMALALWLVRLETTNSLFTAVPAGESQTAAIVVAGEGDQDAALADALVEGSTVGGQIDRLIIDDVVFGSGEEATAGDTVTVHYIGTLQNGQQFDNSYTRGAAFTFTLGEGRVIAGWERGIEGMKVGGQRVLVIPSDLAYGSAGAGPIPGDATLIFAVEMLSINP